MLFSQNHFIPVIPELFLLGMVCIILIQGLFFKKTAYFLSQLTLLLLACLTIKLSYLPTTYAFNHMFVLDKVASLSKLFIYLMTSFAFWLARRYNDERKIAENEYIVLGLFSVLGMMIMVSASNFLSLFLGIELLSLPLYAMVAMHRTSAIASEAAMKYFIMGSLASGLFLYGLSLLYGATGTLNLQDIIHLTQTTNKLLLSFSLIFIIASLCFKLGVAPFHFWAPDVYEGAPTSTVLFLSAAPKIAVFVITFRILGNAFLHLYNDWQGIIITVAILSMAIGNIIAIAQSNLKRMLAYSSIAHMGYMSLGIIAATPNGFSASFFYVTAYALMSITALGTLILMSQKGKELDHFNDLRGLNIRNPWLAFMMLIVMFSMAGIPVSIGFFAKLGVLQALITQNMIGLAALALIFSIIGAYYYLRVVKIMYFDKPEEKSPIIISKDLQLILSITGLLILGLGIFPNALLELCRYVFI
ncbi:MAG: NADH-quinone oxidoreductase subunit N [Legionellaceae bacterium]